MCGIVYRHNADRAAMANSDILQQYQKQQTRGREGFGVYNFATGHVVKRTTEEQIRKYLLNNKSNHILFHHRFPTSTDNVKTSSHPFDTGDTFKKRYIMVHNGVIWNDNDLKRDHAARGIKYSSIQKDGRFNDSEALAYDLGLYLDGQQQNMQARGSIAFIAAEVVDGKPIATLFGRNTNPLHMDFTSDHLALSSEGSGENIQSGVLYRYDIATRAITAHKLELPPSYEYKPIHPTYRYTQPYHGGWTYSDYEEEHEVEPTRKAAADAVDAYDAQVGRAAREKLERLRKLTGNDSDEIYELLDREIRKSSNASKHYEIEVLNTAQLLLMDEEGDT